MSVSSAEMNRRIRALVAREASESYSAVTTRTLDPSEVVPASPGAQAAVVALLAHGKPLRTDQLALMLDGQWRPSAVRAAVSALVGAGRVEQFVTVPFMGRGGTLWMLKETEA